MSVDLKNAFRLSFVTGETAPASGCVGDLALHWVRIDAFPRKIFWEGREGRAAWEHASSGTKHDV